MPLALASSSTHICTSAERHGNEDISGIIGTIGGGYSLSIGGTIGLVSGRSEKPLAAAWVNESAASILKTRGNGSAQKVEEGGDRKLDERAPMWAGADLRRLCKNLKRLITGRKYM
jgi:hypothetical protein